MKKLWANFDTLLSVNLYSHEVKFTNDLFQNPFISTPVEKINFMTVGDAIEYKADYENFLVV